MVPLEQPTALRALPVAGADSGSDVSLWLSWWADPPSGDTYYSAPMVAWVPAREVGLYDVDAWEDPPLVLPRVLWEECVQAWLKQTGRVAVPVGEAR